MYMYNYIYIIIYIYDLYATCIFVCVHNAQFSEMANPAVAPLVLRW